MVKDKGEYGEGPEAGTEGGPGKGSSPACMREGKLFVWALL